MSESHLKEPLLRASFPKKEPKTIEISREYQALQAMTYCS